MEIKGTAVKSIQNFVFNNYKNKYNEWFNGLSKATQEVFNTVFSNQWYSLNEGILEPTIRIGELFFNGNPQKGAWESGRYSANVALHGVYKIYVRFSSPGHVVDRGTRILPAYYNPIKIEQVQRKNGFTKYEIKQCDGMNEIIEHRIGGWMYQALVISGCKTMEIKISESIKTHNRTIYDCSWS